MKPDRTAFRIAVLAGLAVLAALAAPARAAEEDLFAFIPSGGKTLLIQVIHGNPPAAEMRAILTGTRTRDEWQAYLERRQAALPGLKALTDKQRLTLADYLSFNMPLAADKVPADPGKADWAKLLPPDGRDLAMDQCQFCHIITVVVTQTRPQAAWMATMHTASHAKIAMTEKEREALASYLVLNAGIPIEQVPESLRAAGASY